jgi:hypothetical protein
MMCRMLLTLGPDRRTRSFTCACCKAPIERSWCLVHADGDPHALYYANCYHHADRDPDTWIDVIFGTWGESADALTDHVSFGCRVGPVAGRTAPAAALVDAGTIYPDGPLFGHKLSRESGLRHPRIAEFWSVVDFVLKADPLVRGHLYER